jgi:DNA polymerase-3 subunit delta'
MAKGIHPDFRTITLGVADSGKLRTQIIIEDVRDQILAPLALPPYEGKRLIFLVDPANALNETCQNVLLKPLEEPPRYAQFILVTSSPWKLLPTIHSRCQRLGLAPLSREEMAPWVEASSIETGEARGLALAWAAGRPGRVSDFDPGAFRKRRRDLLDLVELGMDASKAQGLFRATERLAKENPSEILRDVSALLADAARSMEGLPPRFHSDAAAELERAAIARGREGLRKLADKLAEAPVYLNHNSNPRLLLEWVFLAP